LLFLRRLSKESSEIGLGDQREAFLKMPVPERRNKNWAEVSVTGRIDPA